VPVREHDIGRSTPQSHAKRLREQMKKDKRRAKDAKRAARKAAKQTDDAEPRSGEHPELIE
jgi:phage/plasmid primase-like uncharacterized protein